MLTATKRIPIVCTWCYRFAGSSHWSRPFEAEYSTGRINDLPTSSQRTYELVFNDLRAAMTAWAHSRIKELFASNISSRIGEAVSTAPISAMRLAIDAGSNPFASFLHFRAIDPDSGSGRVHPIAVLEEICPQLVLCWNLVLKLG